MAKKCHTSRVVFDSLRGFKNLVLRPVHNCRGVNAGQVFRSLHRESIPLRLFRHSVFLSRSQRPRSSDQRGLGNGVRVQIGGGVHVGDASTSDCRFKTHSNVGAVAFCLDVSRRDLRSRTRKAQMRPRKSSSDTRDGEAGRTACTSGRTSAAGGFRSGCLQDTQDLSRAITAGRGGIMSYGFNAVLNHISSFDDAVLNPSDQQPPACHCAPSTR